MEFGNQELRSVQQWFMCIFACLWWFFKVRIDLFITVLNRLCRWGLKNGGLVRITLTYGEVSKLCWPSWKGGAKATLGCSQTQIKQPCCYALKWVPLKSLFCAPIIWVWIWLPSLASPLLLRKLYQVICNDHFQEVFNHVNYHWLEVKVTLTFQIDGIGRGQKYELAGTGVGKYNNLWSIKETKIFLN